MREILLSKGMVALVDDEDYERIAAHKWYANKGPRSKFYAVRNVYPKDGTRNYHAQMHREILSMAKSDPLLVDHIDGDGLNNTRGNLRKATHSQNQHNRGRTRRNTSGYKGVTFDARSGKYQAAIRINGKSRTLGYRDTPKAAHEELWVPAARQFHGEFARAV